MSQPLTENGIPTWNEDSTKGDDFDSEENINEQIFERNNLSCLSYADKVVKSPVFTVHYLNCLVLSNNKLQYLPDEITNLVNLQV